MLVSAFCRVESTAMKHIERRTISTSHSCTNRRRQLNLCTISADWNSNPHTELLCRLSIGIYFVWSLSIKDFWHCKLKSETSQLLLVNSSKNCFHLSENQTKILQHLLYIKQFLYNSKEISLNSPCRHCFFFVRFEKSNSLRKLTSTHSTAIQWIWIPFRKTNKTDQKKKEGRKETILIYPSFVAMYLTKSCSSWFEILTRCPFFQALQTFSACDQETACFISR